MRRGLTVSGSRFEAVRALLGVTLGVSVRVYVSVMRKVRLVVREYPQWLKMVTIDEGHAAAVALDPNQSAPYVFASFRATSVQSTVSDASDALRTKFDTLRINGAAGKYVTFVTLPTLVEIVPRMVVKWRDTMDTGAVLSMETLENTIGDDTAGSCCETNGGSDIK